MQIETIIEYEPTTDISILINKEVYDKIRDEAEKGFDNLKDLKERLPSSISYAELRIAIAKFKVSQQAHLSAFQRKH